MDRAGIEPASNRAVSVTPPSSFFPGLSPASRGLSPQPPRLSGASLVACQFGPPVGARQAATRTSDSSATEGVSHSTGNVSAISKSTVSLAFGFPDPRVGTVGRDPLRCRRPCLDCRDLVRPVRSGAR